MMVLLVYCYTTTICWFLLGFSDQHDDCRSSPEGDVQREVHRQEDVVRKGKVGEPPCRVEH